MLERWIAADSDGPVLVILPQIVVPTFLAVVFTFYEFFFFFIIIFSSQKHLLVDFSAPGESALLYQGCIFLQVVGNTALGFTPRERSPLSVTRVLRLLWLRVLSVLWGRGGVKNLFLPLQLRLPEVLSVYWSVFLWRA